jgi:hypothetical protein
MRMILGAIGGMKIGRGNRSTRRKPTPAPLCPPQNLTWQNPCRSPGRRGGKPATNRLSYGAVCSVVDWGTLLQAGRLRVRAPRRWTFLNLPNPSSRSMTLGSTQHLTEMSTRNLPWGEGGKGRSARKADNLTAICEPIVYRKFVSLDVSQPCGASRPLTGLRLLL